MHILVGNRAKEFSIKVENYFKEMLNLRSAFNWLEPYSESNRFWNQRNLLYNYDK